MRFVCKFHLDVDTPRPVLARVNAQPFIVREKAARHIGGRTDVVARSISAAFQNVYETFRIRHAPAACRGETDRDFRGNVAGALSEYAVYAYPQIKEESNAAGLPSRSSRGVSARLRAYSAPARQLSHAIESEGW